MKSYCIHEGYASRLENEEFDDRGNTNEFQNGVYAFARKIYDRENLAGVCDVGCGSGFKLVEHFESERTLGIDVPCIVAFLQDQYPEREWKSFDLASGSIGGYDLAVCSDVVEHLIDPDLLMEFLQRMGAKRIVISTPERDLLQERGHRSTDGPPKNRHHVREWNGEEFRKYLEGWFQIQEAAIVEEEGTQVYLCIER